VTSLPEDCPANPNVWRQDPPKAPPKVALSDILKMVGMLGVLVAGWFRMESRIERQDDKIRVTTESLKAADEQRKSERSELREELKDIKDKLDRLIEGRVRR